MALPAQTSLLRRIIVGVALLGIVVVTHLALQKANGFAAGCTGLGEVPPRGSIWVGTGQNARSENNGMMQPLFARKVKFVLPDRL